MTCAKQKQIILPALRGIMGDWVYYSCLMDLGELSSRVRYAEEIHKNTALSDMIQRRLKEGRGKQIADYLKNQQERFFNSLVVATYGGQPSWHEVSNIRSKSNSEILANLSENTIASVGFLKLHGDENLFALDGQHRLAGIKKAVSDGLDNNPYDEVSVIFVAHQNTTEGLQRTRRLFTTLNKTAKPVSKGDIIALDEDDVMALSVRWLIEESKLFCENRIAFVATNNMPVTNTVSLTTIGNLYDVLAILFINAKIDLKKRKHELLRVRPSDEHLRMYFMLAKEFFGTMRQNFGELDAFFSANNTRSVVKKYRGNHGGSALYRPIGLEIFARIIARLMSDMSLKQAVKRASKLPTDLDAPPFEGLMWDSHSQTISNSHKVTLREVLLYMLGKSKYSHEKLLQRYRQEIGNVSINLPPKL